MKQEIIVPIDLGTLGILNSEIHFNMIESQLEGTGIFVKHVYIRLGEESVDIFGVNPEFDALAFDEVVKHVFAEQ